MDGVFITEPRAASSQLMVAAQNLLNKNTIKPTGISAVAVSSGPGSYTGLRIAASASKGLCYALSIPLITVNSLLVLTYPMVKEYESNLYCPMLNARRMEVYCALLNRNLNFVTETEAKILTTESFQAELNRGTITFFGDGAKKFMQFANHPNAVFVEGVQPHAENLGYLAYKKYLKGEFENVESFEPMYLKDFMVKKSKVSMRNDGR